MTRPRRPRLLRSAPVDAVLAPAPGPVAARIEAAKAALDRGDIAAVLRACHEAQTLARGALPPLPLVELALILRRCDRPDLAAAPEAQAVARIAGLGAGALDAAGRARAARLLLLLDRAAEAEAMALAAQASDPAALDPVLILSEIRGARGDGPGVAAAWAPVLAAQPASGHLRLRAATVMGYLGLRDLAEAMLAEAEPLCRDRPNEFAHVAAGIRGTGTSLSQAQFAIELFDGFSAGYDENLKRIGNSGPQMVAAVLRDLGLPRDRSRDVLDAGCGTGLCAPLLRPHARRLHGCDLSAGMLQQAQRKGGYDILTRSDLGEASSLPYEAFDLVVSSDVLVYFGDLVPVLRNLATRLRPGGWLVISLEDAGEAAPERGWLLSPSGRYKHREDYLRRALAQAGYGAPQAVRRDRLRMEFARPVQGIALAAQRLALM